MTSPRVTESSVRTRVMASLQRNLSRSQEATDRISSGKQLTRPSDSPTGTVTALQLRGEVRANKRYSSNADDAVGRLGVVQDNLQQTQELITVARNLTLEATSAGGGGTPEANKARAAQLEQIKGNLIQFANSKYLDRPVFGGSTPDHEAYDSTGNYIGEGSGETLRAIGPNAKVRVDVRGPEVYGADKITDANGNQVDNPEQLFHVLDSVIGAMRSGDSKALDDGLKNLDKSADLLESTLSDVGARYNRVTQMKQSAEDRLSSVSSQLSDIEDVDLPKAIMEMQLQQTSYQAALAATAKVIQPSLIEFLR
ncbi:flagellar hook protein [Actinoplanes sp. SE50]|uniref:flagellin N-terminal helical domain-containing protein n=1 Tax=unclassified Actinoplanes TaxID=2626549 RepID=UPI00023EDEBA|nr:MULTISPECIES: flagellin [unclassified Actinoplanes]AEV88774.1 Flagellar filament 33 kDa core protein [Actinoplanes sp. SE50/110]ATO87180.1 flagellar hook protein [Actinoplanes sp. SE50]SLM04598.1 flagellar hook protein [Actinoplanes sp. SE50/110]